MFVAITVLLSLLLLISAESIPNDLYSSVDNLTLASNIYDDVVLKNLEQRLVTLQISNDNLRLRIDSLNLNIEQLFTKQRMEIQKDFEELKSKSPTSKEQCAPVKTENMNSCSTSDTSYADLIDLRNGLANKNQEIDKKPIDKLPKNCAEALEKNARSGIYKIKVANSDLAPFYVNCLSHIGSELEKVAASSNISPWLVIQRRKDGSIDFQRNWSDYLHGFGNLEGEFFIGLHKLYALTQSTLHELWIQLEDYEGNRRWAKYSTFAIGGVDEGYALNILGSFTGDAGDSLTIHAGFKWTTKDVDNDKSAENCATIFNGAWWYAACHHSNLNGEYGNKNFGKGINWYAWHGHTYSMKYVHMAIRPVE